jgi:hypothetical protein
VSRPSGDWIVRLAGQFNRRPSPRFCPPHHLAIHDVEKNLVVWIKMYLFAIVAFVTRSLGLGPDRRLRVSHGGYTSPDEGVNDGRFVPQE